MSNFFIYNDKLFKEGTAVITPDNRSLKYGDGLFETLKVCGGIIQLRDYHFERLFASMETLRFEIPEYFTSDYLENKITELCKKNHHTSFARVRLMIFRGDGELNSSKNNPNHILQTSNIEHTEELNSDGIIIDVYPDAIKSCDKFANLKSNNYLPYIMAALHAKQKRIDDCIILNNYNRVCDTSIANIFIIKNGIIYTPPLSEGCIAGVMRRFMIEKLTISDFEIIEKPLTIEDVEKADEVFITNAIKGIRWVKQFRKTEYSNKQVIRIFTFIQDQLLQKN